MANQPKFYILQKGMELVAKYRFQANSVNFEPLQNNLKHLFTVGTMMREVAVGTEDSVLVQMLVRPNMNQKPPKKLRNLLMAVYAVPNLSIAKSESESVSNERSVLCLDLDIASMLIAVAPEKRLVVLSQKKLLQSCLTVRYAEDAQSSSSDDFYVNLSSDLTGEVFEIVKKRVHHEDFGITATVFMIASEQREVQLDDLKFVSKSLYNKAPQVAAVDNCSEAGGEWQPVQTAASKKHKDTAAERMKGTRPPMVSHANVDALKDDQSLQNEPNSSRSGAPSQTKTSQNQDATVQAQNVRMPQSVAARAETSTSSRPQPNKQKIRNAPDCRSCVPLPLDQNEVLQVVVGDRVIWFWDNCEEELCGTIQWIGRIFCEAFESHSRRGAIFAGIECDKPIGSGDGMFYGNRLFETSPNHAVIQPLESLVLASSLTTHNQLASNTGLNEESAVLSGPLRPPLGVQDVEAICGRRRGIQGNYNSCYLDSTLFTLFSFTDVFDYLLSDNHRANEAEEQVCTSVRILLRETIVNPLRASFYVSATRTMKLREIFDEFQIMPGAKTEEKDPEEFIKKLFETVLRNEPFIKFNSGEAESIQQLFVTQSDAVLKGCAMTKGKDGRQRMAAHEFVTLHKILHVAFAECDIKFAEAPRCLILQLPRSGTRVKLFERTIPDLKLNISNLVERVPRGCARCSKKFAKVECYDCIFDPKVLFKGYSFCRECDEKVHTRRPEHKSRQIKYVDEYKLSLFSQSKLLHAAKTAAGHSSPASDNGPKTTNADENNPAQAVQDEAAVQNKDSLAGAACSNIAGEDDSQDVESVLELTKEVVHLYAVICIERSHYVSFVRTNLHDPKAAWILYDSMADRVDQRGGCFNVPEITLLPNLSQELQELLDLSKELKKKNLDEEDVARWTARRNQLLQNKHIKRLLHDCYVLVYLNADHAPMNDNIDPGLCFT